MADSRIFDVIIVGGSYSGLSAAMSLGRSLRSVLIIDSGLPCNRQTPHSHNFITHDGEKPAVIAEIAKAQVLNYDTVKFLTGVAVSGRPAGNHFVIATRQGQEFKGKHLIFATGIKDLMPDLEGFAACWGISVVHCPYCHGYEFRGKKTGILANGEKAFHIASLVNNLTDDITILTSGKPVLTAEQVAKLRNHNINIIKTTVSKIEHDGGHLRNVVFSDGSVMPFQAVYAAIPFVQHCDIPVSLGCELTEQGYIKVDNFQETNVKGVFACGDNAAMMRSVANAVYGGNFAGAAVNMRLTNERF